MFLPDSCAICDRLGYALCPVCLPSLRRFRGSAHAPEAVDELWSAFDYDGEVKRLVGAVKYRNRRGSVRWIARQMAALATETDLDCVTWVPSSRAGRSKRGYEPSRLLAEAVGKELRLPTMRLLRREPDAAQSTRTRVERLRGPALRPTRSARNKRRLLLVDDVCTTGSSLTAAATVLRASGATVVYALVAARTPHRFQQSSRPLDDCR